MPSKLARTGKISSSLEGEIARSIDHKNYLEFPYSEYYKFSADGGNLYVKRVFQGGQELYWIYDANMYPLDEGAAVTKRSYSAVKGEETFNWAASNLPEP